MTKDLTSCLQFVLTNMTENLVPVHVGLMGHIDHGKTELARALSEKASTAGLDKHPQSKMRGITIDLGFTMFRLGDYLVTLVDAPGHADLIRSVVAGSGIIDTAILTVAADEGPKVQTGEHVVVLQSMEISSLLVAVTKTDLVSEKQAEKVEEQIRSLLTGTDFKNVEFVRVSARNGTGIDELKEKLARIIEPRSRNTEAPLLMPIDHAFPIRGHGTVATGTILQGRIKVGDKVEVAPLGKFTKIRSIQTYGEDRESAAAGDRVGINIPEIPHGSLSRGDYLCDPGSLKGARSLLVRFRVNPLYKKRVTQKMVLSASVGMPMVTAMVVPFLEVDGNRVVLDEIIDREGSIGLLLKEPVPVSEGTKVLLIRTDLPPTQMRIVGTGTVIGVPDRLILHKKKTRVGSVQRVRETDVLVGGLASRRSIAESILGLEVQTENHAVGVIREAFGTRGVVAVTFEGPEVREGEPVRLERLVEEEYQFG